MKKKIKEKKNKRHTFYQPELLKLGSLLLVLNEKKLLKVVRKITIIDLLFDFHNIRSR